MDSVNVDGVATVTGEADAVLTGIADISAAHDRFGARSHICRGNWKPWEESLTGNKAKGAGWLLRRISDRLL